MADLTVRRTYNITDAELCMFTSNLCITMTRDLTDLATFGVVTGNITALLALGNAFEVLPPDAVYVGDVMIATQDKAAKMAVVKETIRTMALRVAMKWGENSGQYRKLQVTGMTHFSEDKLLFTARSVHTIMTGYLTDLASLGLTSGMLDDFEDANQAYEEARNAQNEATSVRDMKAVERITKGNEIYALVSKYCEIGKLVYQATNPSKYRDYVIYGTSGGGGALTAPANFAYNFVSNVFSWDAVTNATSYQIEASDNGTDWAEIYADVAANFSYVPTSGVAKHYRVRARNASGFGDYAAELLFTYYDALAAVLGLALGLTGATYPLTVNVNWDLVTGASAYKVFRSIVNFGGSAGTYSLVDTVGTNTYSEVTVDNKRYYFYVIAANDYRESAACAAMWVDVPVNPA
ncbi:MAG: hypothetical protein NT007_00560 [Candidatus Kapabacteria bacterium]|nr:hypothetical protein [Candidatus Kapabacteria bacterium]